MPQILMEEVLKLHIIFRCLIYCTAVAAAWCGASAADKPALQEVLPDEALAILWSPNAEALLNAANDYLPGVGADIPPFAAFAPDFELLGQDWKTLPAAIVVMPGQPDPLEDAVPAVLLSIDPPPAGLDQQAKDMIFGSYRGYAAALLKDEGRFGALTSEKAYAPSPEAVERMQNSQFFMHINLKRIGQLLNDKLQSLDAAQVIASEFPLGDESQASLQNIFGEEKALQVLADARALAADLLGELEAIDASADFDAEGLSYQGIFSVAEGGRIARYFIAPENDSMPPIPVLANNWLAFWGQLNKRVLSQYMTDIRAVYYYVVRQLVGTEQQALWQARIKDIYNSMGSVPLGVADEWFAAFGQEDTRLTYALGYQFDYSALLFALSQSYAAAEAVVTGDLDLKVKLDGNSTTIDGLQVGKLTLFPNEMNADSREMILAFGTDEIDLYFTLWRKMLMVADSEKTMAALLAGPQKKPNNQTLADIPDVKELLTRCSGSSLTCLFVPARMTEFFAGIGARGNGTTALPMRLPFATPAAFGVQIEDGRRLRMRGRIPQACVSELLSVFVSFATISQPSNDPAGQ